MKTTDRTQVLIFTFSIGIFLLNTFQGSKINFDSDACFPVSLEFGIIILSILCLIIFLLIKKRNIFNRFILPIFMASVFICLIEPYIFDYQLSCTDSNLENVCNSIAEFKIEKGRLPKSLAELDENRSFNTGFKIFNNKFQYQKEDEENFQIQYEVKYGHICEAWNCSTFSANMKYTCTVCGSVEDKRFNKLK